MIKLKNLFVILAVTSLLFSCGKDADPVGGEDNLLGTWKMTGIDYSGTSVTDFLGTQLVADFTGLGKDMNLTISFFDNPKKYATSGDYSLELTSDFMGQKTTSTASNVGFIGAGVWSKNGNTLKVTAADGTLQEMVIVELSGSLLVLAYDLTEVSEDSGVTVTQSIKGLYTFSKQ